MKVGYALQCFVVYLVSSVSAFAQNTPYKLEKLQVSDIDSANAQIELALESTTQADSVRYLEYLRLRGQLLKGYLPAEGAIDSLLAFNLPEKLRLNLLNLKGSVLYYQGKIPEALEFYNRLYRLAKKANFDVMVRKALSNISAINSRIGNADSTIHYAMLSLEADMAAKDTSGFSYAYNYIGLAYQDLQLYTKSISFLKKALLYKPTPLTKANLMYNIGVSYSFDGKNDSSQLWVERADSLYTALDYTSGLVMSNNVMGSNMVAKGKLEKAEDYYQKSLDYSTQIGDTIGIATVQHELAKLFVLRKEFHRALKLAQAAQQINEKYAFHSYSKNTTRMISLAYAGLGQSDSALHYSSISDTLVKYLNQKEYLEDLSEAESKLNLAETELELARKQETIIGLENTQLKTSIIAIVGATLLTIAFLVIRAQQRKKHHLAIMAEKQESLNKEILAAESERSRISKELHDGIGQQISTLSMNLQFLKRSKNEEELKDGLNAISEQLKESARDVRDISHQMMPRVLMESGLVDAVDLLLQQSFKNSPVVHDFVVESENFSLDKKIEISLYRILQELINNIIKHSQASEVHVQLTKTKDQVVMTVRDNGVGISTGNRAGHGMQNIQSRIDMFKGKFKIENLDGTFASINIPLA